MTGAASGLCEVRRRFGAAHGLDVERRWPVEPGRAADCLALAKFHYRPGHPGVITAVHRIVDHESPHVRRRRTIAVLVMALPHPGCVMRDEATGGRYRGLDLTSAMIMLNREFRTISRVIVHPQFRGLGLAVRLVRHALAESETIYVEALAAMGRVHPLFERAGMVRYERPVRPECARLIDALETLGIEPCLLADAQGVARRCAAMNEPSRRWIERELRHWYRKACMQRSHRQLRLRPDFDDLVRAAGNRLMSRPVYYLWRRGEPAPESAP